jgi:hypothetical protein
MLGRVTNAYTVANRKGKRPLGRSGRRGKNNIIMDLTEIGCDGVDCNHLDLLGLMKGGQYLDQLSDCQLLLHRVSLGCVSALKAGTAQSV